ncbi:hypothetical protein D516_2519 [Rhodobacter sp. AKP1]|nr:hypothetical protein D516_2519 [Rhodobacter sp. AKP1]
MQERTQIPAEIPHPPRTRPTLPDLTVGPSTCPPKEDRSVSIRGQPS